MTSPHGMLAESCEKINRALGHNDAQEHEAKKGTYKAIKFEQELDDDYFVPLCTQCDEDPSLAARTARHIDGCKIAVLLSTLGEATGVPGINVVIEVNDRAVKLKDARTEVAGGEGQSQVGNGHLRPEPRGIAD